MDNLSVVISARDEAQWLPAQLHAIHTQGIRPYEIILIDDGSVDDTADIMETFANIVNGIRVTIINHERSEGATASYNEGVAVSTGDYVYCASANDLVESGAFAAIQQALEMWPGAPIVTGDIMGVPLGWASHKFPNSPNHISRECFTDLLGWPSIVHGAACVVSRTAWDSVGGWQEDIGGYADALMWPILAARHGIVYTPHPIAWVRPNAPGEGYGAVALDPEKRRPYLEAFARHILALEEPVRSRLINSHMWDIREFAPEMHGILRDEMVITK